MKCPNCRNESGGQKICPYCGIKLEIDEIISYNYNDTYNADSVEYDEDDDVEYEYEEDYHEQSTFENRSLKIILSIIIGLGILLTVIVTIIKLGYSEKSSVEEAEVPVEETVLEQENVESMLKKGKTYLTSGDYESAEAVYKAIIETAPSVNEAEVLYNIVYNYNRAIKKLELNKYEDARELYDNIPLDYMDYPIKDDVEKLDDDIAYYETNAAVFEEIKNYMRDGDYTNAGKSMELLDEDCLTDSESELLAEYKREISAAIKKTKPEKPDKPSVSGSVLSADNVDKFLTSYAEAMVSAINEDDFEIVSDYLSGSMHKRQKDLIDSCVAQGITQEFESLSVRAITMISETVWDVTVSETETIRYGNGTVVSKTFHWIYTVEMIGGNLYVTDMV